MYGNNSLMTDKDLTFFGDQSFTIKESNKEKDCTKNSSNPEHIYRELNSEISKVREAKNADLSLSNSRNNENTLNDQLIDPKIWSNNNNDTQDSNQYFRKYESLRNKEKGSPKPKVKKSNIQFIPNNNYDYSADTDEFGMAGMNLEEDYDEKKGVVNKISSIRMKENDINEINKNSLIQVMRNLSIGQNQRQSCVTEPDEYYHRPQFSGSFQNNIQHQNIFSSNNFNSNGISNSNTPQKIIARNENRSNTHKYGKLSRASLNKNQGTPLNFTGGFENPNNVNTVPNFPRIINRGSIISNKSTHYGSNNKKMEDENERSVEIIDGNSINEEHFINLNFADGKGNYNSHPFNQHGSDMKVRLPTSESMESNNSTQFNYIRNHPQANFGGMNLNSGGNYQYFFDEETRRRFSASFNDNNYFMHPTNFESAFSMNKINFGNNSNPGSISFNNNPNNPLQAGAFTFQNDLNENMNKNTNMPKQKMNKHTKSDNISTDLYKIKLSTEKNILNLEDILYGRDKRTTVMIRNIPIKYSDEMLMKELEEFKGKFDCLYLPFDYEKNGNRGYAFINFVHPLHILLFYEKFEGKNWNFFESKKICELNSAKFQGINEIKRHARNYKGQKKPSFFIILDNLANLEIPKRYTNQIKLVYPGIILEEGNYGGVKIKSFGGNFGGSSGNSGKKK